MSWNVSVDDDEARYTAPNVPQTVKFQPAKQAPKMSDNGIVKEVVVDLLNALIVKYNFKENKGKVGRESKYSKANLKCTESV